MLSRVLGERCSSKTIILIKEYRMGANLFGGGSFLVPHVKEKNEDLAYSY